MTEVLDKRFQRMAADGLLDVKFDIIRPAEDGPSDLFRKVIVEVEALCKAVDAGHEKPLDFKDSCLAG